MAPNGSQLSQMHFFMKNFIYRWIFIAMGFMYYCIRTNIKLNITFTFSKILLLLNATLYIFHLSENCDPIEILQKLLADININIVINNYSTVSLYAMEQCSFLTARRVLVQ